MQTGLGLRVVMFWGALAWLGCGESHGGPDAGTGEGGSGDTVKGGKGGKGGQSSGGSGGSGTQGGARKGTLPEDGPVCLVSETTAEIAVNDVDKVDLLFMVDNSGSMKEEQAALLQQFPHMISALASGDLGDGQTTFPPVKDVHLGVVSSDLGLVGISDISMCAGLGDDGIMQNEPMLQGCKATYPRFLTFNAGLNTPVEVASDFACIASLGTDGCGFEQQLESTLKALWPSSDTRVTFLGDVNGFGTQGHGDRENDGFLRNDPARGLSLITVVVVTDEEDCSSSNTVHFTPNTFLDPNNPADAELLKQGLNVRCNFNPQNLYDTSRYVNALRALRPNNEQLVVFGAIVGVPPETVNAQALASADFENDAARDQFYSGILNHPLMQPVVENNGTDDVADDTMRASCNTERGVAFPPRRIVEVAKGFGANGMVQSICQANLGPAIDAIVKTMAKQLGGVCLPRPLVRSDDGVVGCDVIWDLPPPNMAAADTPTTCSVPGWPFLLPPLDGEEARNARGGARCRVAQLAVQGDAFVPTEVDGIQFVDGWYYDDFSDDVDSCKQSPKQRIAFTAGARPPSGVSVRLSCLNETGSSESDDLTGQCSAGEESANASDVGDPCLPHAVPVDGFDENEAYLETGSTDCGGGVCIAFHLGGDPREGCVPNEHKRCTTPNEVEQRVYCTCRCDAPEGYAQCACPDGFSCATALSQGSDDVRGGYCVRNGTIAR